MLNSCSSMSISILSLISVNTFASTTAKILDFSSALLANCGVDRLSSRVVGISCVGLLRYLIGFQIELSNLFRLVTYSSNYLSCSSLIFAFNRLVASMQFRTDPSFDCYKFFSSGLEHYYDFDFVIATWS